MQALIPEGFPFHQFCLWIDMSSSKLLQIVCGMNAWENAAKPSMEARKYTLVIKKDRAPSVSCRFRHFHFVTLTFLQSLFEEEGHIILLMSVYGLSVGKPNRFRSLSWELFITDSHIAHADWSCWGHVPYWFCVLFVKGQDHKSPFCDHYVKQFQRRYTIWKTLIIKPSGA